MAEWDSVSQHMHDKGGLNLGRNDRDECYVHAYRRKYRIYMYVTYIYTHIHTHMYLFNSTFQYFDLNHHNNSSIQLPSDSHLEQLFFIMRGKKEAFARHDYFHRIIKSNVLFASGFHNCLL